MIRVDQNGYMVPTADRIQISQALMLFSVSRGKKSNKKLGLSYEIKEHEGLLALSSGKKKWKAFDLNWGDLLLRDHSFSTYEGQKR